MPERLHRKRYSSDLDDAEWAIVKPIIPAIRKKGFGTEGKWHRRNIVDAIFYVTKTGCA
jgi:putative transposase